MNNYLINLKNIKNEPVKSYAPGSPEREELKKMVEKIHNEQIEIPLIIGGKEIYTGNTGKVVEPQNHKHVLATYHKAGEKEILMAIDAAREAHKYWASLPWEHRASVFLKAAELLSTSWRPILNAATMLNQSKTPHQAEIDAACEVIDFWRFNSKYMGEIYSTQPDSTQGQLNRMDYRPLEGFIFAVSPFNFTSIAANLATAPALMGNTILWKPASTAILSGYYLMKLYRAAGLPDGVINFIPGSGATIGNIVLTHPELAGIHFTGSTNTFQSMWATVGKNIRKYKAYPRIVGETGGKDFVFVHPSADLDAVVANLLRGAYEYQGQKCSAASRAYIPKSMWKEFIAKFEGEVKTIKMGDIRDFSVYMGAVIDEHAFDSIMGYIKIAQESDQAEVIIGGNGDKSTGYFIEPTLILAKDPHFVTMQEEIFGPVLSVYVYDDNKYEETLHLCDQTSPYGLTGSIFATDRLAIAKAEEILRWSAGNFYINDKPTGAVVNQQPFGGSRASGTNDKAGSYLNLIRWATPRNIKETFTPVRDYRYPYMREE